MKIENLLERLYARGFDTSSNVGETMVRVSCSQCEAVIVNGVPCHELGCPNEAIKCAGCNNLVHRASKYCADCR